MSYFCFGYNFQLSGKASYEYDNMACNNG